MLRDDERTDGSDCFLLYSKTFPVRFSFNTFSTTVLFLLPISSSLLSFSIDRRQGIVTDSTSFSRLYISLGFNFHLAVIFPEKECGVTEPTKGGRGGKGDGETKNALEEKKVTMNKDREEGNGRGMYFFKVK